MMDLSESNIIRLLKQGLEQNAFNSDIIYRCDLLTGPFYRNKKPPLDEAITKKAFDVKYKIGNVNALSLCRDVNLHKGKEYFWLLFHDPAIVFVLSRLLIDELKDVFALRMSDRNNLVENFLSATQRIDPKLIIRTDISSFFESIDHRHLFSILEANPGISAFSMEVYRKIFSEFERHRFIVNQRGKGLPRGLAVSSYLAELYLQDIDIKIRNQTNISFYGRYVDDIIVLADRSYIGSSSKLFHDMKELFAKSDLHLHEATDGKTSLIDLFPAEKHKHIGEYLGYRLTYNSDDRLIHVALPGWKINQRKLMIDKAFLHFEKVSRFNPRLARRELMDCLNYISGNFSLSGAKKHIKTGIYYSNRHLTDLAGLDELTEYLHSRPILPYVKSFFPEEEVHGYIYRLRARIDKIDFRKRWKDRKSFTFSPISVCRLKAIMKTD